MRAGRTKLPHISTIRLNVIIILYKYPPIVMNTFGEGARPAVCVNECGISMLVKLWSWIIQNPDYHQQNTHFCHCGVLNVANICLWVCAKLSTVCSKCVRGARVYRAGSHGQMLHGDQATGARIQFIVWWQIKLQFSPATKLRGTILVQQEVLASRRRELVLETAMTTSTSSSFTHISFEKLCL